MLGVPHESEKGYHVLIFCLVADENEPQADALILEIDFFIVKEYAQIMGLRD